MAVGLRPAWSQMVRRFPLSDSGPLAFVARIAFGKTEGYKNSRRHEGPVCPTIAHGGNFGLRFSGRSATGWRERKRTRGRRAGTVQVCRRTSEALRSIDRPAVLPELAGGRQIWRLHRHIAPSK